MHGKIPDNRPQPVYEQTHEIPTVPCQNRFAVLADNDDGRPDVEGATNGNSLLRSSAPAPWPRPMPQRRGGQSTQHFQLPQPVPRNIPTGRQGQKQRTKVSMVGSSLVHGIGPLVNDEKTEACFYKTQVAHSLITSSAFILMQTWWSLQFHVDTTAPMTKIRIETKSKEWTFSRNFVAKRMTNCITWDMVSVSEIIWGMGYIHMRWVLWNMRQISKPWLVELLMQIDSRPETDPIAQSSCASLEKIHNSVDKMIHICLFYAGIKMAWVISWYSQTCIIFSNPMIFSDL